MATMEIEDTGPNKLHGRLVNLPTRAMKGSAWTGAERDWKVAPHHYAAIHFHGDDIDDCRWPVTHEITIPATLKSGVYALKLAADDASADRLLNPVVDRRELVGRGERFHRPLRDSY